MSLYIKLIIRSVLLFIILCFSSLFVKPTFAIRLPEYQNTIAGYAAGYAYHEFGNMRYDNQGNLYITGYHEGTADLCPGPQESNYTSALGIGYLIKIPTNGSCEIQTFEASSSYAYISDVTFDSSNNKFVGSVFSTTADLDLTSGVDNHTSLGGSRDAVLSKYFADGTYAWSKVIEGANEHYLSGVEVDGNNDVYIYGTFNSSTDFDPGTGVDIWTSNGDYDYYLTKFTQDGEYVWTKTFGGISTEWVNGIAFDARDQSVYISGYFKNSIDFDPSGGVDTKVSNGANDHFLTKLSTDGAYIWTKTFGGTADEYGDGPTLDSEQNIYIYGTFRNTVDFDPGSGVDNHTSAGAKDIYISKYSNNGDYLWTKTIGGTGDEWGTDVLVVHNDKIIIGSSFKGTADFDPGPGVVSRSESSVYNESSFVAVYSKDGVFQMVQTATGGDWSWAVNLASYGDKLTAEMLLGGIVDFNPYNGHEYVNGGYDAIGLSTFIFPPIPITPTSQPGNASSNPNCISGWKHCVQFGSNFTGMPSYIQSQKDGKEAKLLIEPKAHHDDTFVKIDYKPIDSLVSKDPSVASIPFPWMQGYNIASPIWNYDVVSAFNGYTIPVLDNPAIVVLNYEPSMLGNISPKKLRIGYFDTTTKRWKILPNNTVLNETNHTIANTSKVFGYMAVLYLRE